MAKLTFERLKTIIEAADVGTPRSYSGRGMYGKYCIGVSVDDVSEALAAMTEFCDDTSEAASILRSYRSDSMGRRVIVYWPNIKWPENEKED